LDVTEKYGHLKFTSGEPTNVVLARMGRNSAIVSESFAIRKHVARGDTLELHTPSGNHSAKIEGVYYNYASDLGYNIVWRWQDSYLWESPLATGHVPAYQTIDAQLTYRVPNLKTTLKLGGSNILNNRYYQYAAGPTIGGLYYLAVTVDGLFSGK